MPERDKGYQVLGIVFLAIGVGWAFSQAVAVGVFGILVGLLFLARGTNRIAFPP